MKPEEIHCHEVHDVKEAVSDLAANANVVCYVSQGTGVKASELLSVLFERLRSICSL